MNLVQNSEGIDLPFSCTVVSVLQDRSLVCVQYMHASDEGMIGNEATMRVGA